MYCVIVTVPSIRRTRSTPFYPEELQVRGDSPGRPTPRTWKVDALAGGAVVVAGDPPAAVAPDQHPGRADQPLARDSVLAGEEDPALADHDGCVVGEEADARRLVGRPRPAERARERRRHRGPDLLPVLLVDAGLDHGGVLGVIGHERVGVAGCPRLVQVREHVANGLPVDVGPGRGGRAAHGSPRFSPRGGERHPWEGRTGPAGEDIPPGAEQKKVRGSWASCLPL